MAQENCFSIVESGDCHSEDLLKAVKQVISSHYSGKCSIQEKKANLEWMCQFQNSPQAWHISLLLLEEPDLLFQFFATSMLTKKITSSWKTLQKDQQSELLRTLVGYLSRSSISPSILSNHCLAITSIAFQTVPDVWPNFFEDVQYLSHSPTNRDLYDTRLSWLELMSVLAQELLKAPTFTVDAQHVHLLRYLRSKGVPVVLPTLTNWIAAGLSSPEGGGQEDGDSTSALLTKAMRCLENWTEHELDVDDLLRGVVSLLVECLRQKPKEMSGYATAILCRILQMRKLSKYPRMVRSIMNDLASLKPLFQTYMEAGPDGKEVVCKLLDLYVTFSEEHTCVILEAFHGPGRELEDIVCQCVASSSNVMILYKAFDFWDQIIYSLADYPAVKEAHDYILERLFHLVLHRVKAKSMELNHWESDELREFEEFKVKCGNFALDIYNVIQDRALSILFQIIQPCVEEYQQSQDASYRQQELLHNIEVALGFWSTLSEATGESDNPWTREVLLLLPAFPNHLSVQKLALILIKNCSAYISLHEKDVQNIINYMLSVLNASELCSDAAETWLKFSQCCPRLLLGHLDSLLRAFECVFFHATTDSKAMFVSVLANLVVFLPADAARALVLNVTNESRTKVTEHSRRKLQNQMDDETTLTTTAELVGHLKILSAVMVSSPDGRSFGVTENQTLGTSEQPQSEWVQVALTPLIEEAWEIIELVAAAYPTSEEVADAIVDYITVVANTIQKELFHPFLPHALQIIYTLFRSTMTPSTTALFKLLVTIYKTEHTGLNAKKTTESENSELRELKLFAASDHHSPFKAPIQADSIQYLFFHYFCAFSQHFLNPALTHLQHQKICPDLVQSFFVNCATSLLVYMPSAFFYEYNCLTSVLRAAVYLLLQSQCNEVRMLNKFIRCFYAVSDPSKYVYDRQMVERINTFKVELFYLLITNIVRAVSGESPRSLIPEYALTILWFSENFPSQLRNALERVLLQENVPYQASVETKKIFLIQVFSTSLSQNAMQTAMHYFYLACTGMSEDYARANMPF